MSFLLYLKGASKPKVCTRANLEALLNFKYLDRLVIQEKEQNTVLEKGMKKERDGEVLSEHLAYGKRFQREIESAFLPSVSVRFCGDAVGFGLFAEEKLLEGAFVGEYSGSVRKNDDHLTINNYLYEYPIPDYIGRSYVIDATEGNLIRFVNHSEKPNLKPVYAFYDGIYHLILVATRDIESGEQLLYDYGRTYWFVRSNPERLG